MNIESNVNIHNKFDIEVRDAATGKLKQKAEAYNIVLDSMYTRLCTGQSYFNCIFFGTGTGTISATRTSLFTHLGNKPVISMTAIKAIPVSSWKQYIVLNPEDNVGAVLTEVGIGWGAASTNLLTHALLKDSEGNPISITKSATDIITIYATVFITFATDVNYLKLDTNSNLLINYLVGGSSLSASSFGLKTSLSARPSGYSPSITWIADVANKKLTTSGARVDVNTGNANIQAFEFKNVFAAKLPLEGIFAGQAYSDVSIGTGDGATTEFFMPSLNIRQDTLNIKLNGVTSTAHANKVFKASGNPVVKGIESGYTSDNADGILTSTISANGLKVVCAYNDNVFATVSRPTLDDLWTFNGYTTAECGKLYGAALNADGTRLVVMGSKAPFINVYNYINGTWALTTCPYITSLYKYVCMSDNGNTIAVSYYTSGIKVFDFNGTDWIARPSVETVLSQDTQIDMSPDGLSVVYRKNLTTLRMASWNGTSWSYRPDVSIVYDTSTTSIGQVAISADKNVIFSSTSVAPFLEVFDWNGSAWIKRPNVPLANINIIDNYNKQVGGTMSRDGTKVWKTNGGSTGNNTFLLFNYEWYKGAWYSIPNFNAYAYNNDYFFYTARILCSADGSILVYSSGQGNNNSDGLWKSTTILENVHDCNMVTFDTAPAAGVAITADYTVDGLHKTNQYIVDLSVSIKFDELI